MGLDMFANTVTPDQLINPDAQVDLRFIANHSSTDLHYWRKHHDLHGWMHQLYQAKGGKDPQFNCNSVRLMPEDLDALEKAVKEEDAVLPITAGFFFGNYPPNAESAAEDLEFISKAREAIANDLIVYYSSWW